MTLKDIKNKWLSKKQEMLNQIERGREVSRQIQDKNNRDKQKKVLEGKPGFINTLRKHLWMRTTNPLEVMKEYKQVRENGREK